MNHYKMTIKRYIVQFAFTYLAMDYGSSYGLQVISNILAMFHSSVTARPTDRPTDRRGRTEPLCWGAMVHLKKVGE